MRAVFVWLYRKRRQLLNVVPFAFVALSVLSALWLYDPSKNTMEPLIVFLGFLIALVQMLPTAILNAYPAAQYWVKVELAFGGFPKNAEVENFLCVVSDINDRAAQDLNGLSLYARIVNLSDQTAQVKGLEWHDPSDALSNMSVFFLEPKSVSPGESAYVPYATFANTLSPDHIAAVVFEDGNKVSCPRTVTRAFLEGWHRFKSSDG